MDKNKATMIGLGAILLWSSVVGLVRSVSEYFGAVGGAAITYTVASILLLAMNGFPKIKEFSKTYLFWGGLCFIGCELCLSLSIGFAQNGRQAIEVGMVNYLWPTFTIIAAIIFNKQAAKWWVVPGFVMSFVGIAWVLGGEHGLDLAGIAKNVQTNPLSYFLAFADALFWAAYCTITVRVKGKKNGVPLFFLLTACLLWGKYWLTGQDTLHFSWQAGMYVLANAFCLGMGYAVWNIGIAHGNVTVLAGASYFIPILSAMISATLLNSALTASFWQGAALVCAGSVVCWLATRSRVA